MKKDYPKDREGPEAIEERVVPFGLERLFGHRSIILCERINGNKVFAFFHGVIILNRTLQKHLRGPI